MASSSELTLDFKPQKYSMPLKTFAEQNDQARNIEEYLARLEEERIKIDAFKRELPLCMKLLTDAVEVSRQQLQAHRANQEQKPALEEFIPLKQPSADISETKTQSNSDNKASWMLSAQLWSQSNEATKQRCTRTTTLDDNLDMGLGGNPNIASDTKQINGGGNFLPFMKDESLCPNPTLKGIPNLALNSASQDMEDNRSTDRVKNNNPSKAGSRSEQEKGSGNSSEGQTTSTATANNTTTTNSQPHRKPRRCWSPELHRRFVNALQMLGGCQVATPKQIRELMKVDGLTNDEVKSHLQKYRLHTRRPTLTPQAVAGGPAPQLVVLGGIWLSQEYATATAAAAHGAAASIYGAHPATHATPQYCAQPVPQEFYPATPAPPLPSITRHHLRHHQLQVYKDSPELEVRGLGDRWESIEDGKSESGSWKRDSRGNGGERKELFTRREDVEESKGSEITLKF